LLKDYVPFGSANGLFALKTAEALFLFLPPFDNWLLDILDTEGIIN